MSLNITYGVSNWLWTSPFTTGTIQELFAKISKMGFDIVERAVEDISLTSTALLLMGLSF